MLRHDGRQPLSLHLRSGQRLFGRASQRHGSGADRPQCQGVTSKRTVEAENFFEVGKPANTVLAADEIIKEIQIPRPPSGAKSAFIKLAFRKSIDFPIVNCAVMVGGAEPRICLNAVAPKPYRAVKAEQAISGKPINEANAAAAGEAAVADASSFPEKAQFKKQIAKVLVKRALLAAG